MRRDTIELQHLGGLAFVFAQAVEFQKRQLDLTVTTFEYLFGLASVGDKHFLLLGVYRPGSQALSAVFFDELSAVFELPAVHSCPVVVCGDFNIHVDQSSDSHTTRPTLLLMHSACHRTDSHSWPDILNLVITTATARVLDLRVGDMISDHALVHFTLHVSKPASAAEYVTRRAWRRLSHDAFATELAASKLCCDLETCESISIDELVQLCNHVLTKLLDKHCPRVTVRRIDRQAPPWFDADCCSARRHVRATERRYRRTRMEEDRKVWCTELQALRQLYEERQCSYWHEQIVESKGNTKRLWRTFHSVLGDVSRANRRRLCYLLQRQSRVCSQVHCVNVVVQRPAQADTDTGAMDTRHL